MATVIDTGLTTTAIKGTFFSAMKEIDPLWKKVSTVVKSTGPTENYRWLGTVPQMREWGSGRVAKGLRSESYSVENHKYEATIEVDRDELADDQLGQIMIRIKELAYRAATHPDKLLANLLENGATAGYNSYDGTTFFSSNHQSGDSGVQSNDLTYNVSDPSNVSADEFAESYKQAVQTMLSYKDDQGEPMNNEIGKLFVLVPTNLWYQAKKSLTADMISDSTNILSGEAKVIVFPRLSDQTKWFLCRVDVPVRPFIFQDREPLEFSVLADGSEEAFKREKYLYGVRARYALAYGYWQYCVRTTLV